MGYAVILQAACLNLWVRLMPCVMSNKFIHNRYVSARTGLQILIHTTDSKRIPVAIFGWDGLSLFISLSLDLLARICLLSRPSFLHTTDCCVNLQTGFVSKPDKALGRIRLILPRASSVCPSSVATEKFCSLSSLGGSWTAGDRPAYAKLRVRRISRLQMASRRNFKDIKALWSHRQWSMIQYS